MKPPEPIVETPPPPGAIPPEKLLPGLRGELQKNEHVLWQGRGSGRALDALSRAIILRLGLLAVAAAAGAWLMLDTRGGGYGWVVWLLLTLLVLRIGWFIWQTSATPSRQVAMLTTNRVLSVDMLRPTTNWEVRQRGEGRADGKHAPPHRIVVTGTKDRGHIRLNAAPQNKRAYPPYILFNAERPVELAERIKKTLKIDQPIEDRTK